MALTFAELFAPVRDLAAGDALDCWRWLTGPTARPLLLTALGDMFVQLPDEQVLFLDTYEGTLRPVAVSYENLKELLRDPDRVHAWLTPGLVGTLRDRGLVLSAGQCYSPVHPPVLGGTMEPDNFEVTTWRVHLGVLGQIHEQVKDLPPGTPIKGVTVK